MGYTNSYQSLSNSELDQISSAFGGLLACFGIIYLAAVALQIWLYYRVFFRAGYSGWMGLLSLIPGVGPLVCLLVLAFDTWPRDRRPFVPASAPTAQMPMYKPPVAAPTPPAPAPVVPEPVAEPVAAPSALVTELVVEPTEPVTVSIPTAEGPTEPVAPIPPKEG